MSGKAGIKRNQSGFCVSSNLVFLLVLGVTVLALSVMLILSFSEPRSPHQEALQKDLFRICFEAWLMGVGAVFGLFSIMLSRQHRRSRKGNSRIVTPGKKPEGLEGPPPEVGEKS